MSSFEPRLGVVLLAAGESKRFGKENKLLYQIDGDSLLRRSLDAMLSVAPDDFVVVVGHQAEEIESLVRDRPVRCIRNARYREGMGTSLACGAAALNAQALDGVLVCLGDLPSLEARHAAAIVSRFVEIEADKIVVPRFRGKRGHPVCFPIRMVAELGKLSGDSGARDLILRNPRFVEFLEMPDDGCIRDLDKS